MATKLKQHQVIQLIPKRIICLAERLDHLAVELIEPIIKELSLLRVLQVYATPTATVESSRLAWALQTSPTWRGALDGEVGMSVRSLWKSLVLIESMWTWPSVQHGKLFDHQCLSMSAQELVKRYGSDFGPKVQECLEKTLVTGIKQMLGLHWWTRGRNLDPDSEAICIFIPDEVLRSPELPGHDPHTAEDEDVDAQKYWSEFSQPRPIGLSILWQHARNWSAAQFQAFVPHFIRGYSMLNQVKAHQLRRLASVYEEHPGWTKELNAPQEPAPRNNPPHIHTRLRADADRILTRPLRHQLQHRFKYDLPPLVPTNKALQAFAASVESRPWPYPEHLVADAERASEGLTFTYTYDGKVGDVTRCENVGGRPAIINTFYTDPDGGREVISYSHREKGLGSCPYPEAEILWLESLLRCVKWLADNGKATRIPRPLVDEEDHRYYIENESPEVIAQQLLADVQAIEGDTTQGLKLPSLVALYLPPGRSQRMRQAAASIWPDMDPATRQILWDDMIKKIKKGLATAPALPGHEDGHVLAADVDSTDTSPTHTVDDAAGGPDSNRTPGWGEVVQKYVTGQRAAKPRPWKQARCYICRHRITHPHKTIAAMCQPCGDFNLAGSSLSLPGNLALEGKTALVTGCRVNLGFHTVLRLLRCGARVIGSTRYPQDAVLRYRDQPDAAEWEDRLRIVGADFRTAQDAFWLVAQTREIVQSWGGTLDILINNAAQTLTDPFQTEEAAVGREMLLEGQRDVTLEDGTKTRRNDLMLTEGPYRPRVRGGMVERLTLENFVHKPDGRKPEEPSITKDTEQKTEGLATTATTSSSSSLVTADVSGQSITPVAGPSSWVQSLSDIPYHDIITAHSINTFVPLILVRELLPLMNHQHSDRRISGPCGYIVNVSSREGIFENNPRSTAKNGKHVHTNMSKAGLNMLTETEASTAWHRYHVAMNSVDPGYMSAAPEYESAYGGERPLGWEDGAGRVLWPVAMGERWAADKTNNLVWGRFLKHYGAVRVDTRLGRG